MKRLPFIATILAVGVLLVAARAEKSSVDSVPAHLATARALLAAITPETNLYNASPSQINWADEDSPSNRSVCSSFTALLLQKQYGLTEDDAEALFGEAAPEADEWFLAVRDSGRFAQVPTIEAIRPGDFLVIDYQSNKALPTGHVMLVDAPARRVAEHETSEPLPWPRPDDLAGKPVTWSVPKLVEWHLSIIDSSRSPHGEGDTRKNANADGSDDNGLGRGDIRLLTDEEGHLLGYTWSKSQKSRLRTAVERPLIVGRFRPQS